MMISKTNMQEGCLVNLKSYKQNIGIIHVERLLLPNQRCTVRARTLLVDERSSFSSPQMTIPNKHNQPLPWESKDLQLFWRLCLARSSKWRTSVSMFMVLGALWLVWLPAQSSNRSKSQGWSEVFHKCPPFMANFATNIIIWSLKHSLVLIFILLPLLMSSVVILLMPYMYARNMARNVIKA